MNTAATQQQVWVLRLISFGLFTRAEGPHGGCIVRANAIELTAADRPLNGSWQANQGWNECFIAPCVDVNVNVNDNTNSKGAVMSRDS